MSFKDNLVYLRTSNGLTQERLAVLLGVSRQAISKWESDHAYPEMDKLLTICQVFDCGLDDLVQGDLTHPSPRDSGENSTHPTSTPVKTLGVAAQPKTEDFTGYDQHWRSFAWRLGVGIGLIVAGLAAAAATSDLLPQALADFWGFTSLALGTVLGLAFVIPAGLSHGQFRRLHPFVEDFYSEEDRARGAQVLAMRIVAGVALILLGIATHTLAEDVLWPRANWIAVFVLGFSAPGTCLLVWGGVSHARFNVAGWNHRADGPGDFTDSPQERAKSEARKLHDLVCALIMQVATLIALGTLLVASVGFADTQGGRLALMLFWVAWPLGGILCGIAWMIIRIRYLKDPTANLSVPPTES